MIAFTGVYKKYSSGTPILENANLRINKGEFVYVIGDSGAGKSTLLKMLHCEEFPSRGSVEIFGKNSADLSVGEIQALRRRMGVVFQDLRLLGDFSAFDNVMLSLELGHDSLAKPLQKKSLWKRLCQEVLGFVGLQNLMQRKTSELSGGEQQRVAIARALVRQPEILIADEPTGALDHQQTWTVMELLQKLHLRGTTVILATHDREIVRKMRRRSCLLKSGKLVVEDGLCLF